MKVKIYSDKQEIYTIINEYEEFIMKQTLSTKIEYQSDNLNNAKEIIIGDSKIFINVILS